MKLFWTLEARADRRAIYDYIEADDPRVALELDDLIASRAVQLETHAMMGRAGRLSGTRELVVHRNYILIYDLAGDAVRILRILHAAQQWPAKLVQTSPPSR